VATVGLGLLFGGLAVWARNDPLTAVLVGLGIWIVTIGAAAVVEPASLWNGLVVKAIVVVLFVNGITTGMTYNKLRHTVGAKF
jgi:hypothetical protein